MSVLTNDSITGDLSTSTIASKKRKEYMYSELNRLQNEWNEKVKVEIPDATKYERKELLDVDRAGVEKSVKESEAPVFQSSVNSLMTDSKERVEKQENAIASEKQAVAQKSDNIRKEYEKERASGADDMIKQGIARSSIAQNLQQGIDESEKTALEHAKNQSDVKIKGYELEITLLKQRLQEDLSELKISHANKVQERIDKILKEIDQENAKILEYNNEMEKLEVRDQETRARLQNEALQEKYRELKNEARYGYTGDKKENYLERVQIVKDYFGGLPKDKAIAEFKADEKMESYLGLYYDRVLSYLYGR